MAGRVMTIEEFISPDEMAEEIARNYVTWERLRGERIAEWKEVQAYIFATDTSKTSNSKLPWSNRTVIPKLCQIRDNLYANYLSALFPKRKWVEWEGDRAIDEDVRKKQSIESYMHWAINRNEFYDTVSRLVLDYIDYGNVFVTPDWVDNTHVTEDQDKVGYVGPTLKRINPMDIVFNPIADSFAASPKIIRSFLSLGEVKEIIDRNSKTEEVEEGALGVYDYLKNIRDAVGSFTGTLHAKDSIFDVAGFGNFRDYLENPMVEVLTFYGDIYNKHDDVFLRNQTIVIVDRHKIIYQQTDPSFFGTHPIFHAGWRVRQDNIWAMGPLDNLVGMQYRIDHLENIKADVFDLFAYPPLKVTGYVEDFEWGPFERIYVGDDGDVSPISPDVQALTADTQISILENKMELYAGAPREAAGFRTPGEKTAYEVQRIENAAARLFLNKIAQLERSVIEEGLNAMLELARRKIDPTTIRIFDDELKVATFKELTAEDITGSGRIRPYAARHFAE
ncbi:MAG: hypothetical protein ACXABY_21715, partial [Candidatus Thorarchaeota archaeon]